MLNITNHQRNIKENHEILPQTYLIMDKDKNVDIDDVDIDISQENNEMLARIKKL